jgi:membrane-bound lytic murein transglycosylase MltF
VSRSKLGAVLFVLLYGLSGAVNGSDTARLPSIDAAPAGFVSAAETPSSDSLVSETRETVSERDALQIEAARRFLRERHTRLTHVEIDRLSRVVVAAAHENELEPMLILAVIAVESGGDAFAVSPVGALGLMQILPPTGQELAERLGVPWRGPQTLFDPYVNVRLGAAYLRELADRYDGEISTALVAYNWGPGHIDRRLRRGTPLPVRYSRLVFDAYDDERDSRSRS